MAEFFNPLRTYTADEIGEMMHCSSDLVRDWINAGLLSVIKAGRGSIVTSFELERFQKDYTGMNIANLKQMIDSKKIVERRKEKA